MPCALASLLSGRTARVLVLANAVLASGGAAAEAATAAELGCAGLGAAAGSSRTTFNALASACGVGGDGEDAAGSAAAHAPEGRVCVCVKVRWVVHGKATPDWLRLTHTEHGWVGVTIHNTVSKQFQEGAIVCRAAAAHPF